MVPTILSSPIVMEVLLPFLLVFTVVFAILQKTSILGKGKKQIDAIVSLVIGLIVVAFGYATNVIVSLMPVLAVTAIIILVFMILYGMVHKEGELDLNKYIRGGVGILVGIIVVVSVLILTGGWDYLIDFYNTSNSDAIVANVAFVIVIIVAIAIVVWGKGKKEDSGSSGKGE